MKTHAFLVEGMHEWARPARCHFTQSVLSQGSTLAPMAATAAAAGRAA